MKHALPAVYRSAPSKFDIKSAANIALTHTQTRMHAHTHTHYFEECPNIGICIFLFVFTKERADALWKVCQNFATPAFLLVFHLLQKCRWRVCLMLPHPPATDWKYKTTTKIHKYVLLGVNNNQPHRTYIAMWMGESITTNCHRVVTSLVTFDMKYPGDIQCSISTHSLEGGTLTTFLY